MYNKLCTICMLDTLCLPYIGKNWVSKHHLWCYHVHKTIGNFHMFMYFVFLWWIYVYIYTYWAQYIETVYLMYLFNVFYLYWCLVYGLYCWSMRAILILCMVISCTGKEKMYAQFRLTHLCTNLFMLPM